MGTKLKKHFPMIREREEVLVEIAGNVKFQMRFAGWESEQQEEFLDICTGAKGLKFLNDALFKEILNLEYVSERFNDFLSCMLCQKVKVLKVLPGDSVRIADETSLLIMNIVVELEDGSIANVEMQKIGYLFPGQRCACYSSDLLLRQYRRVREEKKKKFSYDDIRNVYTIVLFEKSPKEFQKYSEKYYHSFEQKPGTIISLIGDYPEFREIYREGYEMCLNAEKVMDMFSKELYELDRNTVQYMIDKQQKMLDAQKERLKEQKEEVNVQKERLKVQKEEIDAQNAEIEARNAEIDVQKEEIDAQKEELRKVKEDRDRTLRGMVKVLRDLKVSEPEIITRICELYRINEQEAGNYLSEVSISSINPTTEGVV